MTKEEFFQNYPRKTIKLGITMAGAVSAGAYSAGVMYYLIQALEKWQELKEKNLEIIWRNATHQESHKVLPRLKKVTAKKIWKLGTKDMGELSYDTNIPMHDVVIEVIGGASAGSLAAAISVLSFVHDTDNVDADLFYAKNDKGQYIEEGIGGYQMAATKNDLFKNNLLYDSWCNMTTGSDKSPMEILLSNLHSKDDDGYFSLLNAQLIRNLAKTQLDKLYADAPAKTLNRIPFPPYISKELHVLFSLASLRGVPIGVKFSEEVKEDFPSKDKKPAHYMSIHSIMAHFTKNGEPELDPYHRKNAEFMIDTAIASGAFPIGLPPKKIGFPNSYIRNQVQQIFPELTPGQYRLELDSDLDFDFAAIDGGTLNNEPFTEVDQLLTQKIKDEPGKKKKKKKSLKALILIDPFPNFDKEQHTGSPKDLLGIIGKIIGSLRGQAMFKSPNAIKAFSDAAENHIGMIFPSRRNLERERQEPALASASIAGFAGFFKKEFRIHDFHLGMKNCQSFIRQFFHLDEKEINDFRAYKKWEDDAKGYLKFVVLRDGKKLFPIIPDVTIDPQWKFKYEGLINEDGLPPLIYPKIDSKELTRLFKPIRSRIFFLLPRIFFTRQKEKNADQKTESLFKFPSLTMSIVTLAIVLVILVAVYTFYVFGPIPIFITLILIAALASLLYIGIVVWASQKVIDYIADKLRNNEQLIE